MMPTLEISDTVLGLLGVLERDRKTQMPALVWSFVFGFAVAPSLFTARRMSCRVHHCPLCLGDGLSPLA